jgi:transcriptional antiterminator RfaH
MADSRWYVVQCKPREERRALEHLERQDFQCYLPLRSVERVRRGAKRDLKEPLFPGYLFIRLSELNDNWQPIHSTRGVVRLVRFKDYPVPVPEDLVGAIELRLADHYLKIPYLKPGERVSVVEGAFSDVEAIFVANDGDERAILLINILQREQEVSFPVAGLRKIA